MVNMDCNISEDQKQQNIPIPETGRAEPQRVQLCEFCDNPNPRKIMVLDYGFDVWACDECIKLFGFDQGQGGGNGNGN